MTDRPRGLIRGSGRRGASRALESVVSVRFNPRMLARIRGLADESGLSVSEWIRSAASAEALHRSMPPEAPGYRVTGWHCRHVRITAGGTSLYEPSCGQGCEMQPVYEPLPAVA